MPPRRVREVEINRALLRRWPLPMPDAAGDKETRGKVLVLGGEPELVGAAILAGVAALRAGAGKLQLAVAEPAAVAALSAVPEARVISLPVRRGALDPEKSVRALKGALPPGALLAGPGLTDEASSRRLLKRLVQRGPPKALVLDAGALCFATERAHAQTVITPHAGELAHLLELTKEDVQSRPAELALETAKSLNAVVALKGGETFIASPDGELYVNRCGNVGLATSGSGDTLSGVIAGLCARGAEPLHAAVWGVHVHACAGDELARKTGPLGFLARELLHEIPPLLVELGKARRR